MHCTTEVRIFIAPRRAPRDLLDRTEAPPEPREGIAATWDRSRRRSTQMRAR